MDVPSFLGDGLNSLRFGLANGGPFAGLSDTGLSGLLNDNRVGVAAASGLLSPGSQVAAGIGFEALSGVVDFGTALFNDPSGVLGSIADSTASLFDDVSGGLRGNPVSLLNLRQRFDSGVDGISSLFGSATDNLRSGNLFEFGADISPLVSVPTGAGLGVAGLKGLSGTNFFNSPNAVRFSGNNGSLLGESEFRLILGDSPVNIATQFQGSEKFPGFDRFREVTIQKGTILVAGAPGLSGFFTTESGFRRSGGDASNLFGGLQVPPRENPITGNLEFRNGATFFEVTENVRAAFGIVRANPQFGSGGLPQVVVPNSQDVTIQRFSQPLTNRIQNEN